MLQQCGLVDTNANLNTSRGMVNQKPLTPSEGTPQYNRAFIGHGTGCKELDAATDACSNELQTPSGRVSDTHLASRKASEAAERRYQAASWLQHMVGPLCLSVEPSEEELRSCLQNGLVLCNLINKVHPGAVPKIVENPVLSAPPEGVALSAFQYFENVRNFLVAVEEMKLPSFDASDLEKGGLQTGWSTKVVDCILSIKAYHEWQQAGGHGCLKLGGSFKTPSSSSKTPLTRARLACSWLGSSRTSDALVLSTSKAIDLMEETENACSNFDSSVEWVQHVCKKFVEMFMSRSECSEQASGLGIPDINMPREALLKLVLAVLHDKNPEEVAVLVECMLKKVIEEFGQQALCSDGQGLSKSSRGCQEGDSQLETLEQAVRDAKSVDQGYVLKLELQNNELKEVKCVLETTRLEFQNFKSGWEQEMEALGLKLHGLSQAATEYHKVAAENRELYNQVQDLKGNIRVYCRVRPFLPGQGSTRSTVDFVGEKGSIMIINPAKQGKENRKAFTFNKVFGPSASQEEVFLDTQPLIRSVLDGYNVCIFAYGQTGSGKTHTMTGPNNPSPMDWGVNFRALHDLFKISQQRQDLIKYEVAVQMMEIYNEQVRDLLCTDGVIKKLEIRNNSQQNGLNVPDANLLPVKSIEDVQELMTLGHKNRAVGATVLNERSSRSHSVLTVHIKGIDISSRDVLRGCLHLVDLAGSERVDKSEVTGDRLREAQHINKSLSALGDVISALAQKSPHVPYRNSKLTQLLQDSLGGQAKTLMFVHVSPDEDSHGETISTLKFAERVATVELGAARSNKESGEVKDLKDQITLLKDALSKKEGEVERYQKELKARSAESIQEKQRVRAGVSPAHLGIVAGHGIQRSPLEEVGNTEIRHSLAMAPKCTPTTGLQMMSLANQVSPIWGTATEPMYSVGLEEDSFKRRAHQYTPPTATSEVSSSGQVGSNGVKKNKIWHGSSCDELQLRMARASHEGTRSSMQSYKHDGIEGPLECNDINSKTRQYAEYGGINKHSRLLPLNLHRTPNVKALPVSISQSVRFPRETDDCENSCSTQEEAEVQGGNMSEVEQILSDDCLEAESRQSAGPYQCSSDLISKASSGKRRKDSDKRFASHLQAGHLAKKPTTATATAMSSKEHVQAGLTTSGTESKRMGGKVISQPKVKTSKKPT
eukprot:c21159_g1_i1 orf=147-3644(+)